MHSTLHHLLITMAGLVGVAACTTVIALLMYITVNLCKDTLRAIRE